MGQGHGTFVMIDQQGLDVVSAVRAGGGIADVSHRDVPLAHGGKAVRVENVVHQAGPPVSREDPVVVDDDAGTLLAPVLQGEKAVICQRCQRRSSGGKNSKNTTLIMDVVFMGTGHVAFTHALPACA